MISSRARLDRATKEDVPRIAAVIACRLAGVEGARSAASVALPPSPPPLLALPLLGRFLSGRVSLSLVSVLPSLVSGCRWAGCERVLSCASAFGGLLTLDSPRSPSPPPSTVQTCPPALPVPLAAARPFDVTASCSVTRTPSPLGLSCFRWPWVACAASFVAQPSPLPFGTPLTSTHLRPNTTTTHNVS